MDHLVKPGGDERPSWPDLFRPSTPLLTGLKDVDARDNPRIESEDGHDGDEAFPKSDGHAAPLREPRGVNAVIQPAP
jgi:hypothetical protein